MLAIHCYYVFDLLQRGYILTVAHVDTQLEVRYCAQMLTHANGGMCQYLRVTMPVLPAGEQLVDLSCGIAIMWRHSLSH